MKEFSAERIAETVEKLYVQSCLKLPEHIEKKLYEFGNPYIIENFEKNGIIPLCQDTGMCCVYLKVGQDAHINGNIEDAVNEGVRKAVKSAYLRSSVVSDPVLRRKNTGDNTPAFIYYELVPGEDIEIKVAPRGAGCENKAKITMFAPADGIEGIKKFVLETAKMAVPDACPPIVVGVGIGGDFDSCALMAKKACLRVGPNPDPEYAAIEEELYEQVKKFCIGVNIMTAPTHIACMPCAVSIGCHSLRYAVEVLK